MIYLFAKEKFRLAKGDAQRDVWRIDQERDNLHPAPFPLELPLRCIQATDAQVVLDPFMGSGTTAVAAEQLGRNWIGIELLKKFCDDANDRLGRKFNADGTPRAA